MIEVENLTKKYGDLTAIRDLTFEVKAGEVVGFLGANGAGKTTTLRILACFMPASSGTARIDGFDVFRDSLEVRRRIGYLPEMVPLYGELRVNEYLSFRAGLKGVRGTEKKKEIERVLDRCQLKERRRQTIQTLSRGLKQRVGLADALLGSPALLILDEPTSGLDPLQRLEVRKLVSELKQEHTVFLSTHILSEVEAMCSRVLILNRGGLVPEGEIGRIKGHSIFELSYSGPVEAVKASLKKLEAVRRVDEAGAVGQGGGDGQGQGHGYGEGPELEIPVTIIAVTGKDPRPDIVELFAAHRGEGWRLLALRKRSPSLEEVFTETTSGEADA